MEAIIGLPHAMYSNIFDGNDLSNKGELIKGTIQIDELIISDTKSYLGIEL